LITTVAATAKGEPREYALEGSVFVGGAVIQWLRDELGIIRESRDSEYFASKVADSGGVYVVPAFAGLGAPYWDMNARGTITGLTRGAGIEHIIRASLESIAYQTQDLLEAMVADSESKIETLRVDGGAASNNFLMQFQADIAGAPVERPCLVETTAMGASYLAGLAVGFYQDLEDICAIKQIDRTFIPQKDESYRIKHIKGWKKAVSAALLLAGNDSDL
jgi:glycerol kinase